MTARGEDNWRPIFWRFGFVEDCSAAYLAQPVAVVAPVAGRVDEDPGGKRVYRALLRFLSVRGHRPAYISAMESRQPTVTVELLDRLYAALPPRPRAVAPINALNVRPGPDQREARESIELDPELGAIGDRWIRKTWLYLPNKSPDPRVQVAVCNSRILALIEQVTGVHHHPGDTLFTDLDLSVANLPVGARLKVGEAVLEISDVENDACAKFATHYGPVVFEWIRLSRNRSLRLRGLFAKIISRGVVQCGDSVSRLD